MSLGKIFLLCALFQVVLRVMHTAFKWWYKFWFAPRLLDDQKLCLHKSLWAGPERPSDTPKTLKVLLREVHFLCIPGIALWDRHWGAAHLCNAVSVFFTLISNILSSFITMALNVTSGTGQYTLLWKGCLQEMVWLDWSKEDTSSWYIPSVGPQLIETDLCAAIIFMSFQEPFGNKSQ